MFLPYIVVYARRKCARANVNLWNSYGKVFIPANPATNSHTY